MKRKHLAVLLTVLGTTMLVAGAFGALAASSSSPDYANATQVTDGSNMTQFNGSDTEAYYLNRSWASNNPEIRVQDPESNETVTTWTKSDLTETVNNSTSGTYYYRANFTEAHLEEIEMDSGENKSIRFRMVANASVDEANETYTNWTVYAENVDGRTTYRLGPTAAANDDVLTLDTDGIQIETLGWHLFKDDYAEFEQSNVPINGSGSNVTLHYANSTSVDALDQSVSDYSSGDWAKRTLVEVETTDGETVRMKAYKGSLPDDVDAQSDSYALINEHQDTAKIHFGDDFEGDTKVDSLAVRTNDDAWSYVSFYQTKLFGFDSLDFTFDGFGGLLSVSGGMTALSGLALAARPGEQQAA